MPSDLRRKGKGPKEETRADYLGVGNQGILPVGGANQADRLRPAHEIASLNPEVPRYRPDG